MSAPTSFGAVVVPSITKYDTQAHATPLDSPALTPAVSNEDLHSGDKPIPPHSPFYQHPPASFERVHTRTGSRVSLPLKGPGATEKDVELGPTTPLALTPQGVDVEEQEHPFASKVDVDCSKECRMWPSKNTLMQDQQARRKQKRSKRVLGNLTGPVVEWWQRFDKRQRLWIKILIALVLIGVAVAIAVGITVAVNGTVYAGEDSNQEIPNPAGQR